MAKLRKDKDMTQEELAEKLNVSSKSISRWETGKCMPDLSLLVPLSRELGVNVNDLLSGKKNEKEDCIEALEENIVNIVSKVDKENKNRNLKTLLSLFLIIFIVIPILILCTGEFLKIDLFPSFSSFKIMNKANQFYEALTSGDTDKIDELLTDNASDEMCWGVLKNLLQRLKKTF